MMNVKLSARDRKRFCLVVPYDQGTRPWVTYIGAGGRYNLIVRYWFSCMRVYE